MTLRISGTGVEGSRASAPTPLDGKCEGLRLRDVRDVAAVCIVVGTAGCRVESDRLLHFVLPSAHEGNRAAHADAPGEWPAVHRPGRCARDSRRHGYGHACRRRRHWQNSSWGCPTGFRRCPSCEGWFHRTRAGRRIRIWGYRSSNQMTLRVSGSEAGRGPTYVSKSLGRCELATVPGAK